mgnify:FL=1
MLCIVVYISHCPPSTVSADSGYPFLLCFYFCPEFRKFLLDLWLLISKDFVIRVGCIRNIRTDPGIVPLLHGFKSTLHCRSIPYFFRIGKSRFITDHKINKFMGKLYFAAVLCDNHCIIPSVGSLFRCEVVQIRIFTDNVRCISGVHNCQRFVS